MDNKNGTVALRLPCSRETDGVRRACGGGKSRVPGRGIPLLRGQRVLQAPREGGHGEGGVPILRGGIREEPWNRGQRMVPAAEAVHLREAGGAGGRRTEVQLQARREVPRHEGGAAEQEHSGGLPHRRSGKGRKGDCICKAGHRRKGREGSLPIPMVPGDREHGILYAAARDDLENYYGISRRMDAIKNSIMGEQHSCKEK